jgi:hypothetical protein
VRGLRPLFPDAPAPEVIAAVVEAVRAAHLELVDPSIGHKRIWFKSDVEVALGGDGFIEHKKGSESHNNFQVMKRIDVTGLRPLFSHLKYDESPSQAAGDEKVRWSKLCDNF